MDVADICKKFGLERLMRHLMHVLVKMEKIVWDNEWQGSVDDVPSERSGGFFGVYDAAGFALRNAASMQGMKVGECQRSFWGMEWQISQLPMLTSVFPCNLALQFWLEWTKMSINYFPSVNRRSCVINGEPARAFFVLLNIVCSLIMCMKWLV